jgi:hypothetical protein
MRKHLSLYVLVGVLALPCVAGAQARPGSFDSPVQDGTTSGNQSYIFWVCRNADDPQTLDVSFNAGPRSSVPWGLNRNDTAGACNNDGGNGGNFVLNSNLLPAGVNTAQVFHPTTGDQLLSVTFVNVPVPGLEFLPADQAVPNLVEWQSFPTAGYAALAGFSQSLQGPQILAIATDAAAASLQGSTITVKSQSVPVAPDPDRLLNIPIDTTIQGVGVDAAVTFILTTFTAETGLFTGTVSEGGSGVVAGAPFAMFPLLADTPYIPTGNFWVFLPGTCELLQTILLQDETGNLSAFGLGRRIPANPDGSCPAFGFPGPGNVISGAQVNMSVNE